MSYKQTKGNTGSPYHTGVIWFNRMTSIVISIFDFNFLEKILMFNFDQSHCCLCGVSLLVKEFSHQINVLSNIPLMK